MKKIKYLEGFRGIAAIIVVISHFSLAFYPAVYTGTLADARIRGNLDMRFAISPLNIVTNGNFAVTCFFVLSGFVLTYKFFITNDLQLLTSGAVRRYFRLVLPVFFSIFISYILMITFSYRNQIVGEISRSEWFFTGWLFEPDIWEAIQQGLYRAFLGINEIPYNNVTWTMRYELIGAMIVFGAAALMSKIKKGRVWVYFGLIIAFLNSYYLAFILGMILSELFVKEKIQPVKQPLFWILPLFIGLYLGSFPTVADITGSIYEFLDHSYLQRPRIFYHIIGSFLVFYAVLIAKPLQRFLSIKGAVFLGEISFSMYLIHLPFLGSASSMIFLWLYQSISYGQAVVLASLISFIIILGLSYLVYRWVDQPGIKFSRFVYKKLITEEQN